VPNTTLAVLLAGVGWPLTAYFNNKWYQRQIQTIFREIADKQLADASSRGFN
jgi:hypothetical protein